MATTQIPYTGWRCTGTPGATAYDFTPAPDAVAQRTQLRGGVLPGRVYGSFENRTYERGVYTQLRHGPLPGRRYASFQRTTVPNVMVTLDPITTGSMRVASMSATSGLPPIATVNYPIEGEVFAYEESGTDPVATVEWSGFGTVTLEGSDAALFSFTDNVIAWLATPDFETPLDANGDNLYELQVVASNASGEFVVDFAVQVTNVVDVVPTITFPTASPVQVPSGRAVAFSARSLDDASSRTWSITGGADAALFDVVASTGRVSFLAAPDYASPADFNADNDYELTLQVETSAGTDTQAVVVRVVDQQPSRPAFGRIFVEAAPSQPVVFDTSSPPAFDAGYGS